MITNKKIILVTGGSGLVGNGIKYISGLYNEKYEFVFCSSKQYDLTIMNDTIKMFKKHKPNYVIHLAACVGGLFKNMNNKVEMLEKNLMINYNVVKCAHDYKVEKLIACLSTCIFPDKEVIYPIDESMLHNGAPHFSNDAYAYAKRMLEIHCRCYKENHGNNFTCIIPTNIYGPNDNFDLENGHVLPALIHKCFLAKQQDDDFIIRGTGKPLRQFIFSYDLAKIIMILFEKNINQRIIKMGHPEVSDFNFRGHNLEDAKRDVPFQIFDGLNENVIISVPEEDEISIGDIGKIIADNFEYGHRVAFDSNYSDGQYKKTVGIEKLKNIIGNDFQFTNIKDGIKISIEWFLSNYTPVIMKKDE
jgi:GDP-L-fucose synthase